MNKNLKYLRATWTLHEQFVPSHTMRGWHTKPIECSKDILMQSSKGFQRCKSFCYQIMHNYVTLWETLSMFTDTQGIILFTKASAITKLNLNLNSIRHNDYYKLFNEWQEVVYVSVTHQMQCWINPWTPRAFKRLF